MKILVTALLLLAAGNAVSASSTSFMRDWPSCDIEAQHSVAGETGGSIHDPLQAHISVRANVLQADIGNARKARHLSESQTGKLWREVESVRTHAGEYVKKQGFLSAAERASYDRELDDVAHKLCRAVR